MKESLISPRKLLLIDFSCALGAGVVYACLFDFMRAKVGLPEWLVYTHILVNILYGMFGVWIFVSGRMRVFRVLAWMNVGYVVPCLVVAGVLGWSGNWLGTVMFLVEGVVVGGLGKLELVVVKEATSGRS